MLPLRKPRNILMWLTRLDDPERANFRTSGSVAYHKFFDEINKRDNFRFAHNRESYLGDAEFSNVSKYVNGVITQTTESFKADVIYHFSNLAELGFDPGSAVITNTPEFRLFCNSKMASYEYMPEYYPKTFLVFNEKAALDAISHITTQKVVLKPNKGESGKGVNIIDLVKYSSSLLDNAVLSGQGYIIQEFLDTSCGIPNITPSYHDLRITTHGDKLSLCHIRIPKEGSLISNVHQGGSLVEIDIDSIPSNIMDFYKEVHKKVTKIHKLPLYNMDLGVGKDGPRLIELNSHTAFPDANFRCMDRFIENLIDHLETIGLK